MSAASGRFVWYDLMTTNTEAAKAFYTEIIGWKTSKWEGGDYETWAMGDKGIGGLMVLPEQAKAAGAPPHWMGYVAVDDVDTTARKAESLGATIYVPGTDIPNVGRFAVLGDHQGATFAIFSSPMEGAAPDRESLGRFSWAELNTTDWESAWKFYSALFGWKPTQSMDMGEFGQYFMFGTDSQQSMGGMSNAATMMKAPAHWLHYINVDDVDETARRITEKGGKILNGPMDIPGNDRIAQCMDPQGGYFAIYSSGRARS